MAERIVYSESIGFRAPAGTQAMIDEIAKKEQMKPAELLREALRQYLADYREVAVIEREQAQDKQRAA